MLNIYFLGSLKPKETYYFLKQINSLSLYDFYSQHAYPDAQLVMMAFPVPSVVMQHSGMMLTKLAPVSS